MPLVKFTKNLQRFFPNLESVQVEGTTVRDLVFSLDEMYPGLAAYIVDDHGALRQHVNIFIGEELILDKLNLSDPVNEADQVFILQALSGG